ncbi:MAG TPA: hypothetical protein VGR70_10960 [Stellaceae bacterium]|nr:hypothetical protein [Stellaceae bacterium]
MSIFLNIVSAVLILPLVAFSLFILSVDMVSGRPAGHWFGKMLDILLWLLPDPDNPVSVVIGLLAMVLFLAGLVYLTIRFVFVYPLIMLVLGVLTLALRPWMPARRPPLTIYSCGPAGWAFWQARYN